jgi:hypothetical protein
MRRFYLRGSLLALFVIGCDGSELVEPPIPAPSTAASVPKVNAPSSTAAVAVSESRIEVSWQDNSTNEIGFEVHTSTTGTGGAFAQRASAGAGVTRFSDAGLSHSSQYCYKVRALRTNGNKTSYSPFSSVACATTPAPPPPAAPLEANAWPGGSTGVWVTWIDNSTTEAGVRVERSLDLGTTWTTAGTVGATEYSSFFDADRVSEQQVCYRVTAFNAGGDSPASTAGCTAPPTGPSNLTATLIDGETMEVELTWTDNSTVEDGYEVWVDPCCAPIQPVSLPANSTSFRFYWYFYAETFSVVATKDGGRSDPSNWVTPTSP